MNTPFSRSSRLLTQHYFHRNSLWILAVFILLPAWFYWLFFARVSLYQNSAQAHFQITGLGTEIVTPVDGLISYISDKSMTLGATVKEGDVLLEFEHEDINTALANITRIQADIALETSLLEQEKDTLLEIHTQQSIINNNQVNNLKKQAELENKKLELQTEKVNVYQKLYNQQQSAKLQLLNAQKELQEMKIAFSLFETNLQNIQETSLLLSRTQQQERLSIEQKIAKLTAQLNHNTQQISQLEHTKSQHIIRASTAGSIASLVRLELGQYLHIGNSIGKVISTQKVMIEAQFIPEEALGHLAAGQQAKIKVPAFPWTQYGTIDAEITKVASAVYKNRIRVQLTLINAEDILIPLSQDMPVNVEITTAVTSPINLLLNSAGVWITNKTGVTPH